MRPIGEWESRERELGGKFVSQACVAQRRRIARNWLRWNVPKERGSIVARFFTYGRYWPEKARGPSFKTAPFQMVMIEKHTKEVPRLNPPPLRPDCASWILVYLEKCAHIRCIYFEFHPTIKEKHVEESPLNRRNLRACVQVCYAKHLQPLFNWTFVKMKTEMFRFTGWFACPFAPFLILLLVINLLISNKRIELNLNSIFNFI